MKRLLFILLSIPLTAAAQHDTVRLNIYAFDCRSMHFSHLSKKDTIHIFKDGELVKEVFPERRPGLPIRSKLTSGTYRFTFRNIYGQLVSKTVTFPKADSYELNLCMDELTDTPRNSLSVLQAGDTIKINFESRGCFNFEQETLMLTSRKSSIWAIRSYGSKIQTNKLNEAQLEAFRRFENELVALENGGGCTTTDWYTVTRKGETVEKMDGSCSWNGYYFLIKAFFGSPN